ncbi:hypothetical protein Tco_0704685 [Tanacetum coccineum]|uniref:Uncharacterized protein n=1 Tax=Tanacetum coccineum TaxID=301880 RepID=A0ABQ4Y2D8_9ASTR
MTDKYFVEYTRIEYDRRVNKRQLQTQESKIDTGKAVDANLVVIESSGTESEVQDDNSKSGNDTDADDVDVRPVYDEEPLAEVQLTTECNIFATGQHHTEQPKIVNEGRVDRYTEQCQVKSLMLNSSPDNQTTDNSKQSLESENILLKKTVAQFQKDFSRMEAQSKIKKEIDVLETMNIELEHNVAKLRKENETLKKHYKYLYDSIKITRSKTIEQTTSLLANNADLKAQIKEKVFAIVALKNDVRKLKGNSVDTKFAKTSVLGKSVLQSLRKQLVARQPNAFKSERPQMSKPRFTSQVDVSNNLSRPVTQHYLPKRRESISAKPNHMIASSESRDSSKNMPRFSSNDMVHNHYLDKAKKKTQERDRNSKTNVIPSARFQSTADGSKPKPRSTNHSTRSLPVSKSSCVTITAMPKADSKSSSSFSDSKHFVYSTCHKCVFNANQVACITKLLKEIFTRHRFSPNKTYAMYEKTSPRSDLRWKPTGRIFKSVGLGWIPTGKLFDSYISKDDREPTHGSNVDISNIHESKETLDLSAGTLINVQKEQSLDLSAVDSQMMIQTMASNHNSSNPVPKCLTMVLEQDNSSLDPQSQENVPQAAETVTTSNELDLLFSLMFDELLNGTNPFISKSSVVHAADAPNKCQQHNTTQSSTMTVVTVAPPLNIQTTPQTTNQAPTQVPTVTANENIIQGKTNNE